MSLDQEQLLHRSWCEPTSQRLRRSQVLVQRRMQLLLQNLRLILACHLEPMENMQVRQ